MVRFQENEKLCYGCFCMYLSALLAFAFDARSSLLLIKALGHELRIMTGLS